jgi:queuine tRNA-ribosyltransferase
MDFRITHSDEGSSARRGIIDTDHGTFETPIFMPVGTLGTVKGVAFDDLEVQVKARIILGNTYHLYLRPGLELLKGAGGIHGFTTWRGPVLTDSGGYQVYSLADSRKITEEGVRFKSHIDGSLHEFTPERVMDIQRVIGADFMMAFDECPPWPSEKSYVEDSMHLTHRWLERCIKRFQETEPAYGYEQILVPIVQGGTYMDLRKQSSEYIADLGMPLNAVGGLSVGEPKEIMYEMTEVVDDVLPKERPRYLMGVGTPANLLENIARGMDMFDCVMPSRNARNGMLFTSRGIVNIRNERWKDDHGPIDEDGTATIDHRYSRAYLRHLFMAKEMLGPQLATIHNLTFYLELMRQAREHISQGDFSNWKDSMVPILESRL